VNIEINFEVFKQLTALRESEADSYSAVIRRLLESCPPRLHLVKDPTSAIESGLGAFGTDPIALASLRRAIEDLPANPMGLGAWYGKLRATYKGQTHLAEIRAGAWLGADGVTRTSPSDAASSISGTNVNGWRFWHVQRPGDVWRRLDELR
jgi:hypothetical protein